MRRKRHHRKTIDINSAASSDVQKKVITSQINCIQSKEERFQPEKIVKSIASVVSPPNSSQELYVNSNKVIHSNFVSIEESSNTYCPEALQPLTNDSCELFLYCKEENLTPEQLKFHTDEWMNYVKFTANIHNLPYVSAVKGSDIGEHQPKSVVSPELPVLVYSNSVPSPQSVEPPVPSSIASNVPIILQVPSPIPSPSNGNNATVTQCNIPSVILKQPSIFPVKLQKSVEKSTEKGASAQSIQEEILPFVLQEDSSSVSLLNKVKDAAPTTHLLSLLNKTDKSNEQIFKNDTESVPSPSSQNSDSDICISPELLCSLEVNLEESDTDCTFLEENTSAAFCSDLASDNSNGPKIVDVVSGDAGANEFFRDSLSDENLTDILSNKPFENDSQSAKDLESSSNTNVVYSSESSLPKTVTQFSIFSMQKTIAVISCGIVDANIHNLLGVRHHIPPFTEKDFASRLYTQLRKENFMTLSPWWMIQKHFLPSNPPCTACGGRVFRINSCYEFLDGLCWTCDNTECRKIYQVKRPKFFDRFPSFSLEELLLLTYHWACKSRIWVIVKDVPVHEERIWSYFTALQELCANYVNKDCVIGKNMQCYSNITVEASAVKLGKFFILCAYDRKFKVSRLQVLTTEEACGSIKHIRVLQEWLSPHCTLITWKKINDEFLPGIIKVAAEPNIGNVQSPGRHILNASRYLGKTMVQLFQNLSHDQLTLETIQGILNEVQWRERKGKTEESAFWGIMNEISCMNDPYIYTEALLGEISKDRFFNKADMNFRLRWGPKTSSTFNVADKAEELPQVNPKSAIINMLNSTVSSAPATPKKFFRSEIDSKRHPISVVGLIPVSNVVKEKQSINPQELLSIRITFPGDANSIDTKRLQAFNIGVKLRKEGFLLNPVRWFVKHKYIKDEAPCYVCQGKALLVDNPKFPDGVSWLCQKSHCRFDNRYKRPSFFGHFGFRLDVIMAAIFHWAVQSDYNTTVKSIPLNEFNIISIHRKLQKICAEVAERDDFRIGGKKCLVEVAFVRFANCFILGAMERESSMSRFRSFSIETKLHIDEIRKTLISWLRTGSTVIVNSNKYLGRYCMEERINLVFADKTTTDVKSKTYHTLTITNYLQNHIKTMFRNLKPQHMSSELLQVYMDELMWRERYRKSPFFVFQCILRDIFAVEFGVSSFITNTVESSVLKKAASFYGFSLPLPEIKIALQRLPEHVINSYTCPVVDTDEVTIIDDIDLKKKEIKVEVISDDDEEIEVVNLTPNPETCPSTSSTCSQKNNTEHYFILKKNPVASTSKSEFLVNKSEDDRKYSDKCYSRKKKEIEETSNWKLPCAECRDFVTIDHFAKPYTCGDCKYNVYSTYCQKAFARHRAYILFGRKIPESNNSKKFFLPQEWYCECGYSSLEGNELASHLIQCRKTTCYLNILKPSSIL